MIWSKDSKKTMNPYNTKKSTIQQFKSVYSGNDYPVHLKYSDSLNITFLAFLYGTGMPIMFPMAAIILFNQSFTERIILAYYSKLPPAMDD